MDEAQSASYPFDAYRTDLGITNEIIHSPAGNEDFRWELTYLSPERIISIWRSIDPEFNNVYNEHGYQRMTEYGYLKLEEYVRSGGKLPALVIELQRDGSYVDMVEGLHRVRYAMEHHITNIPVYFIQILYKARWN